MACPIDRKFDEHLIMLACSRALESAGNRMPMRTAIIPITTKSSTSVNPLLRNDFMTTPLSQEPGESTFDSYRFSLLYRQKSSCLDDLSSILASCAHKNL